MTSMTDVERHPEVEEISALVEGILPPGRLGEVRDHVRDCDLCADVLESLESIRELLGTLPGPPRMPADVAGRIDAALAAESLLASTGPTNVSRETEADAAAVSRETTPAPRGAADRPRGHADASRGPGRKHRRRRMVIAVATACCAGVLGIGGIVHSMNTAGGPAADTHAAQQKQAPRDRSTLRAAALEKRVHALLAEEGPDKPKEASPEFDIRSSPTGTLRGGKIAVPPCIQQATHRTETAIAAESGTFRGADAYLVVLPHATDAGRVDAYVVDSSCLRKATPSPGKVLLTRSYARH